MEEMAVEWIGPEGFTAFRENGKRGLLDQGARSSWLKTSVEVSQMSVESHHRMPLTMRAEVNRN